MRWGIIKIFCSICGREMMLNQPKSESASPWQAFHHRTFGYLCSKACLDKAEDKYAKMILGHDDI